MRFPGPWRDRPGMEEVESYLLTRHAFKASTLEDQRRHWRALESYGWSLDEFLKGPRAAEAHVERVLVAAKMDGRPAHTIRNFGKIINRCLLYAKGKDKRYRSLAPWPLEKAPRPRRDRFTDHELAQLVAYTHRTPLVRFRRRAMLAVAQHTGLRRSEVSRLRRGDAVASEGRWWLTVTPAKGGDRRMVPMPTDDIDRRFTEYLDIRDALTDGDALWITPGGNACGPQKMGQEFHAISKELGFQVSFTKFRRTFARSLRKLGVHDAIGMHALGQSSPKVFQGYAGAATDQDLVEEYHAKAREGF